MGGGDELGDPTMIMPNVMDMSKRISELEACVRALFLIVMDGGDDWDMKGKANEVFKRAALPK